MAKANVRKASSTTPNKVPSTRMPQRSEGLAGKEETAGMQPIPAAKEKTPLPAAKRSRETGRH